MDARVWVLGVVLACGCGPQAGPALESPRRGALEESFVESAKTRLAQTYRVVTPVAGTVGRVEWEPGDRVTAGQELVVYDRVALEQAVVEARARVAELEAQLGVSDDDALEQTMLENIHTTIDAAQEALRASHAQVEAEQARERRAGELLALQERLAQEGAAPEEALLDARLRSEEAGIELRKQRFMSASMETILVAMRLGPRFVEEYLAKKRLERLVTVQQLAQARAQLVRAEHELACARIVSPVDGVVLERFEQGGGPLPAGQPLLHLGDLAGLEVVAEVLTQDALRLKEGGAVWLTPRAGVASLEGTVRRVEPAAFTKRSSLGVEQQRVHVLIAFAEVPETLGVGFQVEARFVTGSVADALIVPRYSVLEDAGGRSYVIVEDAGRFVRRDVTLGVRNDLELEVASGLEADDRFVVVPTELTAPVEEPQE